MDWQSVCLSDWDEHERARKRVCRGNGRACAPACARDRLGLGDCCARVRPYSAAALHGCTGGGTACVAAGGRGRVAHRRRSAAGFTDRGGHPTPAPNPYRPARGRAQAARPRVAARLRAPAVATCGEGRRDGRHGVQRALTDARLPHGCAAANTGAGGAASGAGRRGGPLRAAAAAVRLVDVDGRSVGGCGGQVVEHSVEVGGDGRGGDPGRGCDWTDGRTCGAAHRRRVGRTGS